jgi:hypothetical protein
MRDEITLDSLRDEFNTYSTRLGVVETAIAEIGRRLNAEDGSIKQLQAAIKAQTDQITTEVKAVRESIDQMRENLLILTLKDALKDAGQGIWTLGGWIHAFVKWWLPIVSFALVAGAVVLWLNGKGPYPK